MCYDNDDEEEMSQLVNELRVDRASANARRCTFFRRAKEREVFYRGRAIARWFREGGRRADIWFFRGNLIVIVVKVMYQEKS